MTQTSNTPSGSEKLYYRIGDVAQLLGVKAYVLRYWESEFAFIHPQKSPTGQRVYKKSDVESLFLIRHLLYVDRYSVEGARKKLNELRKTGELKEYRKNALKNTQLGEEAVVESTSVLVESSAEQEKILLQEECSVLASAEERSTARSELPALASFLAEAKLLAPVPAVPVISEASKAALRNLALELKTLAQEPLSALFQL